MKQLRNKRCLITGAASGIGRAIAIELARKGARLGLVDCDAKRLEAVAVECRAFGAKADTWTCDLSQPARITELTTSVLQHWQAVDVLINNAGVAFYGPTETMTGEQWNWLLAINLLAPIQISRELLPTLLNTPGAHVLNMCSISGLVAAGRFAAYHVSKYGLIGFTEALRAEYSRRGLGVTALCPGPVKTNLYTAAVSGRPDRAVPQPPNWLCASPETVAKKAVRAIESNHAMVLVTPMAHFLWRAKRFMPGVLVWLNGLTRKKHLQASAADAFESATLKELSMNIGDTNSASSTSGHAAIAAPHVSFGKNAPTQTELRENSRVA